MLREMREYWQRLNTARANEVRAELEVAMARQSEVTAFWDAHKQAVKKRWATRTGGRGSMKVADIPEVAAQWHSSNRQRPDEVSATAERGGPYWWRCPRYPDLHPAWSASPKDRVLAGTACPACRQLTSLADLPTLAAQYDGAAPAASLTYAAHTTVPWRCRTWAADPWTGHWQPVEHLFEAVVKGRSLQQDSCLVCAGFVIDVTNNLQRWFPELAEQLDNAALDPALMSPSKHNASRNAQDGTKNAYQTVPWVCGHGHRWEATVLNRVLGAGCPSCSTSGISKEQVRLAAELASVYQLLPPPERDPRLPAAVPDFAPRHLPIPDELKPEHWRYRPVEVDVMLWLPVTGATIGVEYDGAYHHGRGLRQDRRDECEKSGVLAQAGLLDLLVHVRAGALDPLEGEHLMSVPVAEHATAYEQASAVARALRDRFPLDHHSADAYLAMGSSRGQADADAYITAVWGQLKPPRPRGPKTPPKLRALKETAPAEGSRLAPAGAPYRNPDKPEQILRAYACACGNHVHAVQAEVARGNTTSCGCRKGEAVARHRAAIAPDEARDIRAWARQRKLPVGVKGRIPDRLVASYRLHKAGLDPLLDEDGLIPQRPVEIWVQSTTLLSARGRLTSNAWMAYADHHLNSAGTPKPAL